MRRRAPQFLAVIAAVVLYQAIGFGQATFRPTSEPIVTAENESWYLNGQPITFAGIVYYPTGPNIFFHPYEMVRSGDFNGVPLYVRPTMEPYSVVYVPLPGRLMKPYERRRSGDLAGTVGSTTPSFPVPRTPEGDELSTIAQAAAPPTQIAPSIGMYEGVAGPLMPPATPPPAPTAGIVLPMGPLVSARKPEGLNGMFVEYGGRRWFTSGPVVELDRNAFTRIGEYRGFPVYQKRDDERTIYIAVAAGVPELLSQYAIRR